MTLGPPLCRADLLAALEVVRRFGTLSDLCWPLWKSREALALCLISNDGQAVQLDCFPAFGGFVAFGLPVGAVLPLCGVAA